MSLKLFHLYLIHNFFLRSLCKYSICQVGNLFRFCMFFAAVFVYQRTCIYPHSFRLFSSFKSYLSCHSFFQSSFWWLLSVLFWASGVISYSLLFQSQSSPFSCWLFICWFCCCNLFSLFFHSILVCDIYIESMLSLTLSMGY